MEISPAERIRSLLDYTGTVVFKCTVCHKSLTFALDYWRSEQDVWEPPFGRTAIWAHYALSERKPWQRAVSNLTYISSGGFILINTAHIKTRILCINPSSIFAKQASFSSAEQPRNKNSL